MELRETRTSQATLDTLQSFVINEPYAKKIRLKCLKHMIECSLTICLTLNPAIGKYSIVLIPTFLPKTTHPQSWPIPFLQDVVNQAPPESSEDPTPTQAKMNFMLWNC